MSRTESKPTARVAEILVWIFLVAITWLVFGQTLGHAFINYDDGAYVTQNKHVLAGLSVRDVAWAFTHFQVNNWHPVTMISHMLDCQFYHLKAGGHHFTNVALHSIAVVLLFVVLRDLTNKSWRSAFVAALFAIHPLHVESVAWVAERKDVLSGVFFMLTLCAYARYARKPGAARYLTMSILFALGLMSKAMLVTTPLVLLFLDYWPLRRLHDLRTVRQMFFEKIPLFILSAASSVATILAQKGAINSAEELPLSWRMTNAVVTGVTYLWQMIWPANLAPFYPHPFNEVPLWEVGGAFLLLVVLTAAAFRLRKRAPYLLTGWLWYVSMLLPVIGVLQVGAQAHADRYTYLPHIGLYLLATWAVTDMSIYWRYRRPSLGIAAGIIIVALTWRAWVQTSYWRSSETLWRHALAVTSENNDMAHAGLGGTLLARGEVDTAIPHFQKALQLRPTNALVHASLARALLQEGHLAEAIMHWQVSLELRPNDVNERDNLARGLLQDGRLKDAIAQWQKSLEFDADDWDALNNLAWVFATAPEASLRNGAKAVELAERAIQLTDNNEPIVFSALAAACAESGRFSDAINSAKRGMVLANAKNNSELRDELQRNIALYEAHTPLRDNSLSNSH